MSGGATVRLNGIDVYFERSGSGPRLLVFNGSGSSIREARMMIDVYSASFDVLVHDQRGLGQTEIPDGPYSMADYAADAIALLDHVGWESCRVVGTSFGGMVAQEFAVTVPERVERMALLCTSPGGIAPSYPLHLLADLPAAERASTGLLTLDTRFTPEFLAANPEQQGFVDMIARRNIGATKTADQLRGEREQLLARAGLDVVDRLGRVTCPTLVASGAFDGIAPPENGRLIAERIPGATYREYDGGHLFMAQDRRAMPDILGFLAG